MKRTISEETKQKVLKLLDDGMSRSSIAESTGISKSSVGRINDEMSSIDDLLSQWDYPHNRYGKKGGNK